MKGFLHRKIEFLCGCFWIFLFKTIIQTLFWFFTKIFMRLYSPEAMNPVCSSKFSYGNHQIESEDEAGEELFYECFEDTNVEYENVGELDDTLSHKRNQIESNCYQSVAEPMRDSSEFVDHSGNLDLEEEETSKLVFKFQYQSWNCNYNEELKESYTESLDFEKRDIVSPSTNKYEFIPGNSLSQILDKPVAANFAVKEFFVHSIDASPLENQVTSDSGLLSEKKSMPANCEEVVNAEIHDNCLEILHKEEVVEELKKPLEPYSRNFLSDNDFICSSSDSDSVSSSGDDGFLSDTDFGTTTENDTLANNEEEYARDLDFRDDKNTEDLDLDLDFGYEPDDFGQEDKVIMDELGKLEEECRLEESLDINNHKTEKSVKGKQNSQSLTALDIEESNRFDTLWEHQDLIEQLKMELKKVRATGLPTILEDSVSPRIMEDLKPWKIDEKFQHGSTTTNELPKFYKSYRERMRKFDILNYQKMYALGLLQSKDPLQSFSTHKNASPAFTCILPRIFKRKNTDADPMNKFVRELYSDLEMVYVGQLCLSWEFLQWEYEKALKIWESDQFGSRRFNEVAGEFQQFQVLLQRFIENEPFQGPRVENYARNRCAMRNLLQVPVIKEDKGRDKKKLKKREEADNYAITSDMLVEILEESIRTIWRFIRADKDASHLTIKGLREHHVEELQDPTDSQLLVEIRMDLQKKEKRLKEVLRSGNCILKKFQKHHEDGTDPVLYFFSQVDMKLVWRVLNMSRITTDQLAWCRSKLNKINFVNRRIHVEPSFLLFPS